MPAKLTDEEIAEIKKLPADEQPIALAQVTCPVSDDHLGEMGAPIKQVVDGKTVLPLLRELREALKADPAKYPGQAEEVSRTRADPRDPSIASARPEPWTAGFHDRRPLAGGRPHRI